MLPEEVIFQGFMLTIAVTSLVRAAQVPYMAAFLSPRATLRDGKTFRALFAPAGVSWRQYKAMTVSVLEWIQVTEGETLPLVLTTSTNDDDKDAGESSSSMYWVYDGRVHVEGSGSSSSSSSAPPSSYYMVERESKSHASFGGEALIGEGQLLDHVVVKKQAVVRNSGGGDKKKKAAATDITTKTDASILRVVSPDATVLRVNVPGLKQLMENDPELENAMRSLLFQSMDAKLRNASGTHWAGSNNNNVTAQPVRAA